MSAREDDRPSALDGDALSPGDAEGSELISRITSDDPDIQMPPPDAHKKPLTEHEIALLRRWIDQGATYTEHWSLAKLERPVVPPVAGGGSSYNPIDRFLAAAQLRAVVRSSAAA